MTLLEGTVLVPFVVPGTALIVWVLSRRGWAAWRVAVVVALVIYLSVVAAQTLFPITIGGEAGRQPVALRDVVHLHLFDAIFNSTSNRQQAFLNVMLGIPLGVLLPAVGVRPVKSVFVLGLLFALGIEGLQLLEDLILRTEFRTVDINDVILNWLGVAIGIGFYGVTATAIHWWPARQPPA